METRANYVLVGLFTLAAIAGAFGFVYWLVRFGDQARQDEMFIVFSGPVTGLATGSGVLFNGIKVGQVEACRSTRATPRSCAPG
jgi:phospholipid/cholesterol/gamma-HCH transport system substrate-binding protein